MNQVPTFYFYVVNRSQLTKLRYQGLFVPRVGDTIRIADCCLKVVDVVIESAGADGAGVQHALYVHTETTDVLYNESEREDLELEEFCARMR